MRKEVISRLGSKTPQEHFLRVLREDFKEAPRVAEAILAEATEALHGTENYLKNGQIKFTLTRRKARVGQPLTETDTVEIIWTLYAGKDDIKILKEQGAIALRRAKIMRLLTEALEQNAVATQEDLAYVLHSSIATIKRDFKALQAQNISLPSRGYIKGVGRGQTHKTQIVSRWLKGQTYDQISQSVHHTHASIKRYINTFSRVVWLRRQEKYLPHKIAMVIQISEKLVQEYLELYEDFNTDAYQERLTTCLDRVYKPKLALQEKKGGKL